MTTVREHKNIAMDNLVIVMEELYGGRCSVHEAGCGSCVAWALFDTLNKFTDSAFLDEEVRTKY